MLKSCCNCLCKASGPNMLSGYLLDPEMEEGGLCFLRILISKWRKPEMKNTTAKIIIINNTAGLIFPTEGEDGGCGAFRAVSLWKKLWLLVNDQKNEERREIKPSL
uniref:Uncharacterized protein n=1 Tax=Opuntia streptacantha TaxID=393608 RepID=A0A7C9ER79_OPUST